MTKVGIVTVPFFVTEHHLHLARKFLNSLKAPNHIELDMIAVTNRTRGSSDDIWLKERFNLVVENDQNILARAWNKGISLAFERGAKYALVCNLDIEFDQYCINNLVQFAEENPQKILWCPAFWNDPLTFEHAKLDPKLAPGWSWSCFMVDRRLFELLGKFDEGFVPAYQEDTDMAYRMKLANLSGASTYAALVLSSHRGTLQGLLKCSRAELQTCSSLAISIRESITNNDMRYIRKWGGKGGEEKFTIPFNGAAGY